MMSNTYFFKIVFAPAFEDEFSDEDIVYLCHNTVSSKEEFNKIFKEAVEKAVKRILDKKSKERIYMWDIFRETIDILCREHGFKKIEPLETAIISDEYPFAVKPSSKELYDNYKGILGELISNDDLIRKLVEHNLRYWNR